MIWIRVIGLLAAIFAWSASAADFEAGCRAFEEGDFLAAREQWQPLAEQGHPQAQFRMGCLYAYGQGVPEDHQKALALFRAAAEQGDADAQNNLGGMYALGWGVEQDFVEAYMWFQLAAASGLEIAISNRGHVAEGLTPEQIRAAEQRAAHWAAAHR